MGTKVMGASGPSDAYHGLGLLGADVVMVDNQSHHSQGYPLWGNLSNGQIRRGYWASGFTCGCPSPLTFT